MMTVWSALGGVAWGAVPLNFWFYKIAAAKHPGQQKYKRLKVKGS